MIGKRVFAIWCAVLALSWIMRTPLMALTVGGAVRQPLNLGLGDLAKLESVSVMASEVTRDERFHGVFTYRGVPLKTLLGLASVQKEESLFPKPLDLAVVVRNREGQTAVLSWGEIFYHNSADILIAFSADPVMPNHTNCADCHGAKVYEPALNELERKVGLPKLVVTGDFFTDRNLEDVVGIDVIEMKTRAEKKQMKGLLSSPNVTVTNGKGRGVEISGLGGYQRVKVNVKDVSEGMGYHGVKRVSGVPLKEILRNNGMGQDADTVVLASSVDGYRILLSYGELFLNPAGERVLVADSLNEEPLKEGKFTLFFPDDIAYDRTAKALSKVEIVPLKEKARFFVIGVGCADTNLISLQAISYIGKADVFIASDDIRRRFSKYIGDKPVLFDPLKNMAHLFRNENSGLSETEAKEALRAQRSKNREQIDEALKAGKNVAFLEYGDPTIYPSWQGWIDGDLKERVEVIPGLSAFNVSNAMLRQNLTCKGGSLIVTMPRALTENADLLKAVAEKGDTVAIFMGLRELKSLSSLLLRHYPPSTPLHIVYKAGYSNSGYTVKTTLGEAVQTAARDKELHLGMIYIGPCLK